MCIPSRVSIGEIKIEMWIFRSQSFSFTFHSITTHASWAGLAQKGRARVDRAAGPYCPQNRPGQDHWAYFPPLCLVLLACFTNVGPPTAPATKATGEPSFLSLHFLLPSRKGRGALPREKAAS